MMDGVLVVLQSALLLSVVEVVSVIVMYDVTATEFLLTGVPAAFLLRFRTEGKSTTELLLASIIVLIKLLYLRE